MVARRLRGVALALAVLGRPATHGQIPNLQLGAAGWSSGAGLWLMVVVLALFNTVLGEELLFRGLLLPRMRGTFGSADWLANGMLFGLYHLHQPWSIPGAVVAGVLLFAYPTRRFRSAWMGIAIHSAQSVVVVALVLELVIS